MSREILKTLPLVTIAIPCYNKAGYINRCINSVLSQSYRNIEVFFIDDCSTDKSVEIAQRFTDKRFKIIENDKNSGTPAKGLNYSLENGTGDYWMYVSGDDYLDLDAVITLLVNIDDYDYIFGNLAIVDSANRFLERWAYGDFSTEELLNKIYRKKGVGLIPATGLWCMDLIRSVGWSYIDHSDDTMTIVKACDNPWKRKYIEYDYYFYRQYAGQITHQTERREKALKKICKYIEVNHVQKGY